MKTWFESLQPRERLVIAVGGVVSILILAWSFAWTPLRNATGDLDRAVTEKHGTLAELRRFEAIGVTLPPVRTAVRVTGAGGGPNSPGAWPGRHAGPQPA